jgi:hypothetical protein
MAIQTHATGLNCNRSGEIPVTESTILGFSLGADQKELLTRTPMSKMERLMVKSVIPTRDGGLIIHGESIEDNIACNPSTPCPSNPFTLTVPGTSTAGPVPAEFVETLLGINRGRTTTFTDQYSCVLTR